MASVNIDGTWKDITEAHVNVSGTWKKITAGYQNVSGTWKNIYSGSSYSLYGCGLQTHRYNQGTTKDPVYRYAVLYQTDTTSHPDPTIGLTSEIKTNAFSPVAFSGNLNSNVIIGHNYFDSNDRTMNFVIDGDGVLYSWGSAMNSSLGDDDQIGGYGRHTPTAIGGSTRFKAVAPHVITNGAALSTDGYLYTWGTSNERLGMGPSPVTTNAPTKVGTRKYTQIESTTGGFMAIGEDGFLYVWGNSDFGEMGLGILADSRDVPTKVGTKTWKSVKGGNWHMVAIDSNDDLYMCGYNFAGVQMSGDEVSVTTLTKRTNSKWSKIFAGTSNFWGIRQDNGYTYGWGSNSAGELGASIGPVNTIDNPAPMLIFSESLKQVGEDSDTGFYLTEAGVLWVSGTASTNSYRGTGDFDTCVPMRQVTVPSGKIQSFCCGRTTTILVEE